jgi:hypothetical protein
LAKERVRDAGFRFQRVLRDAAGVRNPARVRGKKP